MSNEQNNGGPSDDEIRRLVNLPFNQDENGTEWVTLTPQMLARAVRRALATTEPDHFEHVLYMVEPSQPVDEREAFENEMSCEEIWGHRSLKKKPDGRYANWCVDLMWSVWQARAATAQVSDINVVESFTNDTEDAKRYRWLADSNNYYEAINLISDGSLTEDALGKAIDAAMAKGVK